MSRTRISRLIVAATLPLALMACGSSSPVPESEPSPSQSPIAPGSSPAIERLRASALPSGECPFVGEAGLRGHFPHAPEELESRFREKPYPSCTYVWVSKARKTMQFGGQMVEFPGEGRVS